VDIEGAVEEGEEFLPDGGDVLIAAEELVRGAEGEELLADEEKLVAGGVLEREFVADREVAVDEEGVLSGLVARRSGR
jgi:hypothetical protein